MKIMSARDAKNHFGEFLDKEPDYDGWLFDKVSTTDRRVESGEATLLNHDEAMSRLGERLKKRLARKTA